MAAAPYSPAGENWIKWAANSGRRDADKPVRKAAIPLNQRFLNGLHCSDAVRGKRVIEYPVAAVDHIFPGDITAVFHGAINIAIDMAQADRADILQGFLSGVFKQPPDQLEIIDFLFFQ